VSAHAVSTMTSQQELDHVVLDLLPAQGAWGEEQYLWLTDRANRLIELTDGYVEVLLMPTEKLQAISQFLLLALLAVVQPLGGKVFYAPLRLRIREHVYREPDLMVLRDAADPRRQARFWLGADLVVEIVSPDDPERDLVRKRRADAPAGHPP
jgi:Uma2 family endonuclease